MAGMDREHEPPQHHVVAADVHAVPKPLRTFAVRSEEPPHADDARAPYGRVHLLRIADLDAATRAALAREGERRIGAGTGSEIEHAATTLTELADVTPGAVDLGDRLVDALQRTGVAGGDTTACRRGLEARIDYLAACGAGFHNDVGRHWSHCLFWLLALEAADVEFVMPHAGVAVPLAPGDLLLFDPALAHGLCRPADGGQAVAASFEDGTSGRRQTFLTGEWPLTDAQWAALGAPWLPVEIHAQRGALDLTVAEFDAQSGAIQRVRALRDCMQRGHDHLDGPAA